jgi:hypothetical protein
MFIRFVTVRNVGEASEKARNRHVSARNVPNSFTLRSDVIENCCLLLLPIAPPFSGRFIDFSLL